MKTQIVATGTVLTTGGVHRTKSLQPEFGRFIGICLKRDLSGDWGDLDPADTASNDRAVLHRDRLHSSYNLAAAIEVQTNFGPAIAQKLWVIADPGCATTTILWPIEY